MNILALDLGSRTGWALAIGKLRESGVQTFDVRRGESPGMRFIKFNTWLAEIASVATTPTFGPLGLIVYEQTHHRGGAATEVSAGFATRVQEFCAAHAIEHAAVHSATLKKWTTGSGRADKDSMLRAVVKRGWFPARGPTGFQGDDNEVDAVALLHYALATLTPAAIREALHAG